MRLHMRENVQVRCKRLWQLTERAENEKRKLQWASAVYAPVEV